MCCQRVGSPFCKLAFCSKCFRRLLAATPEGEDPVALLQGAAREHIPVNPKPKEHTKSVPSGEKLTIPDPEKRPSIDEIIQEIQNQEWYKNQIVDRRTFDTRKAIEGMSHLRVSIFQTDDCRRVP